MKSCRVPGADVGGDQADVGRLRRLRHVGRERVVARHVSLPEVVQHEVGVGIDGNRGREHRHGHAIALGIVIAEAAADVINGGRRGRGGVAWG